MEMEALDKEWSLCTPVASPISCSRSLFTLALELNVNQEHWMDWRSGAEGPNIRLGGPCCLKKKFRGHRNGQGGNREREREGEFGE